MELAIALALLTVTALVAFLALGGRSLRAGWRVVFVMTAAATVGVYLTAVAALHRPPPPESEVSGRPIEAATDGYVTSDACQACHPGAYASWQASYHSSMTQRATPDAVLGEFDGVELRHGSSTFRLSRDGDAFFVEMPDLSRPAAAGPPPRVRRRIEMTTGSHHMQLYWYSTGNTRVLALLPFVYDIKDRMWAPRAAAFLRPAEAEPDVEMGRWNKTCLKCHVTQGRLRPVDPAGQDTHVAEFGIACEACHGPGADHVAAHRDVVNRYAAHFSDGPDADLVQPERLAHDRASEVCGQCHSTSIWTSQEAIDRWMQHGFEYLPGQRLADTKAVVRGLVERNPDEVQYWLGIKTQLLEHTFWPDGKNRVAGREYNDMLETPCYQRGELSCMSCHEMHLDAGDPRSYAEWADDQLAPGMRGDLACTQCHTDRAAPEAIAAHAHHPAGSSGAACQNCHMPHTTYGLLKGIRSHQIDSPSVQADLASGRPNACNLCHLDRPLGWTAEWLERWYGQPAPALAPERHRVAESVLQVLRGDAAQRALMARSMGWSEAQAVSGDEWQALHLGVLLGGDPYPAVRRIAHRSLRTLPGFETLQYDFRAEAGMRQHVGNDVMREWQHRHAASGGTAREAVLISGSGAPRLDELLDFVGQRDDRYVFISE